MKFYNTRSRETVEVPDSKCTKAKLERKTSTGVRTTYIVKAVAKDGTKLTKFVSKDAYGALKCKLA